MLVGDVYRSLGRCDTHQEVLQPSGRCERYKKGMPVDKDL